MDDAWGDGWATEAVNPGPVLALPGQAHLAGSGGDTVLLARSTTAAWYAGGENEAAWGALPLFKAVGPPSPGPWAAVSPLEAAVSPLEAVVSPLETIVRPLETSVRPLETAAHHRQGRRDTEAIDSAISLSQHGDELACAQAAWAEQQVAAQNSRRSESMSAAAGPASKALESVDVFEGMERLLSTDGASLTPHPDCHAGPVTRQTDAQDTPSTATQHYGTSHDTITIINTTEAHQDSYSTSATPPRAPTTAPSFSVDLSLLDTLFPASPKPSSPPPAEPLPTSILQDSFTSVSERKAWYRVSRLGSLRQHRNASDDDSYVRVRWAGSCVRERTLDIVRRWKHEDTAGQSKSGLRAGGGAVGFNWDVESPPVEIEKLLRQQKWLRNDQRGHVISGLSTSMPQHSVSTPILKDASPPLSLRPVVDVPALDTTLPSSANASQDSSQREQLSDLMPTSSVAATAFLELPPTPTHPTFTTRGMARQETTSESVSVDDNVGAILDTIPDLSYMLR